MNDRQIFIKTLSFLNILSGSIRSAVIKSLERLVTLTKESLNEVNEICMSLQAIITDLIADTHDDT